MAARALLDDLHSAGCVSVALIEGKIVVAPKTGSTDAMREAIRARRADLAALLTRTCADCHHRLRYGTCRGTYSRPPRWLGRATEADVMREADTR